MRRLRCSRRTRTPAWKKSARRAAVGVGTLYRHFPTRDALEWAACIGEVDTLASAADRLLLDLPPDDALGEWMQRLVDYTTAKRGLGAALRAVLDLGPPRFDDARATCATPLAGSSQPARPPEPSATTSLPRTSCAPSADCARTPNRPPE